MIPAGRLRQLKFLQPPVQCAPADPQFLRGLRAVAAAFIQRSRDEPDFVGMDIHEILISIFAGSESS